MYRRIFALILAFVMVFSLLPGTAMAADETPETEPAATETQETEPKETEPKETESQETEPQETEPKETEPKETEPKETEPKETEPVVTEPVVTEPEETEPQATQPAATEPAPDQKIKLTNPGKRDVEQTTSVTVRAEIEFPEGSWMTIDDVSYLEAYLSGTTADNESYWEYKYLSAQNGWTATFDLEAGGTYAVSLSNVSDTVNIIDGETTFNVDTGANVAKAYTVLYTTYMSKASVSLDLAENSDFADINFEDITACLTENTYGWTESASLSSDGTAKFMLQPGQYTVSFSGYEVDGLYCSIEGNTQLEVLPGKLVRREYTAKYAELEADLSITLNFAEDSDLSGADIGSVVAEIYEDFLYGHDQLVGTLSLNEENGWKGELTVPATVQKLAGTLQGKNTYKLVLSGTEREGYRGQFTGADYTITPMPGDKDGWNMKAKYVEAKNSVTVKVRLSEDSDMPATDLKGFVNLTFDEINDGIVHSYVEHTGSTVFTHTFTELPTSDCYRLKVESWTNDITVQSFICTGDVKYESLEDGQLDFALDENCEIEVVLLAKQQKGEVTVIARFAEDSVLQAEDFPDGLSLTAIVGFHMDVSYLGDRASVSPANNWTNTISLTANRPWLKKMAVEQINGYVGTVELYDSDGNSPTAALHYCPATVYAEIRFVEHKPFYLDVEFVFAEDSALKGADAGSFFLDVDDSGTKSSYEFKEETGWKRTLAMNGTEDGFGWNYNFSILERGFDRPGYNYTIKTIEDSAGVFGGWREVERDTHRLVREICYTASQAGMLQINIISSPYGKPCNTTITVRDADGNVVAEKETENFRCVIGPLEAGKYTVSQTVEENGDYFADGDKIIDFDPVEGASLALLNEKRELVPLTLHKLFDENSELGPDDFPNGITVAVTELTGAFSGIYTLSDANGWSETLFVPVGYYTAVETNADKEGFERTTQFTFTHFSWNGESLRSWSRNGEGSIDSETITDTTGGPYHIWEGNRANISNDLTIYNCYTSIPTEKTTGSITINAGDGFYDFDSNEELDEKPDTGSEAESYTYIVSIDGEEQTVTLKPGETFTLDGLEEGAAYSVTPVLPDGYPWNASAEPITGTIGGDTDSDEGWNVEVSFENDYYYTHEEGVLTIVKTDALTDETLKGAQFGLYSDKDCTKQVAKATTGKDGTCSFTITEAGTYYIKELKAPEEHYVKTEAVKKVTVTAEWVLETRDGTKVLVQKVTASVADLSQKDGGYIWENERKTTDISVTKKFYYDEDLERPESVTIVLYQDGEAYETVKLSAANNWKYVWKDMPLGFEYTVDELNVAKGYYKQIRSSGYDFTVTNSGTWIPQTGDMTNIALWGVLALASIAGLAVLIYKRKKKA